MFLILYLISVFYMLLRTIIWFDGPVNAILYLFIFFPITNTVILFFDLFAACLGLLAGLVRFLFMAYKKLPLILYAYFNHGLYIGQWVTFEGEVRRVVGFPVSGLVELNNIEGTLNGSYDCKPIRLVKPYSFTESC